MDKWWVDWSHANRQQCWMELWQLWVADGVKEQLLGLHCNLRKGENMGEAGEVPAQGDDWPQYCD